jgi:hypothetical protein
MLTFLASSIFFKYAQNEGFAFKTKFDLSISNSLNQIHIEKISFKRHELHTDQGL